MMARSPAKRIFGTILFLLAVLLTLAFAFLLYARSIDDSTVPLTDQVPAAALVTAIALGVMAIVLLGMLLARGWERKSEAAADAEVFFVPEEPVPVSAPTPSGETTVYDLRKVPGTRSAWGPAENNGNLAPYYFPRTVPAGVYVNDYVPIGGGKTLKLRTLMGGPFDPAYNYETQRRAPRPTSEPAIVKAAAAPRGMVLQEVQVEAAPVAPTTNVTYYDYPGDNHEVEDIEGIGSVYGQKLREAGVHTTARLAYEEAGPLAEKLGLPKRTVEHWKMMAELVKVKGIGPQYAEALVRAGVEGIAELKKRSAERMSEQINKYLDSLEVNVIGNKITPKRIEGWQDAARPLKRIKLQVPAQ